ncbi:MAG: serine--tRNA ligase [Patescibacteria group bacterium]|nr:serine--tRNA ligase [Patescibacteria group bacterium]
MIDPKFIREHADEIKKNCAARNVKVDISGLLKLDKVYLALLQEAEALRAERNQTANAMQTAKDKKALVEKGKKLKESLAEKEKELAEIEVKRRALLMQIPNLTHPDAPVGKSDEDNKVMRQVGEPRKLKNPLDHVALATKHDLIDFERAAKVTGAKFYYLKGKLVILEQALIRFALEHLMREGFTPLSTPDLAKDEILVGTGFQPRGPEAQIYSIEQSDLSLIGTAEITLGGYHQGEMLKLEDLPIKYAGISHCFRTEAGAYGRESYGLYRVHQFSKIEMFVFCTPEQSEAMLLELLRHEESLFQKLEIPYQVVDICSGDLGGPAYRKYDLEAWMWGRNEGRGGWGEVTSASNCTDFQARRLNVRTKDETGGNQYVHTLNGTAIAVSRALIAILENHQQPDGTIKIPEVLVPYCGFDSIG